MKLAVAAMLPLLMALPVDGLPRGLLAADDSAEGAGLWLIDDEHFALARWREVPADA